MSATARRLPPPSAGKYAFGVLCAYEAFAVTTGLAPTISALCRRHRHIEVALLAALLVHLHYRQEVLEALDELEGAT